MESYNLKILDCTLRDGGYINDWKFGNLKSRSIVMKLDDAGIDIVECGFLNDQVQDDKDTTVFSSIHAISEFFGKSVPRKAEFVAMIELGHFDIKNLIPQKESVLDGIRLIFPKTKIDEAMNYAKVIKEMGYRLYINPVALFSYSDKEIIDLVEKINKINPVCVSIVDTYGVMFWQDVVHYVDLLDHNLNRSIALDMHSHNNLQLSNANTIEFIRMNLHRDKIVDATLLGMGRRTGNACTEVICSYLEKNNMKNINVDLVFESAYSDIAVFTGGHAKWGYDLDNLIAAIFECSTSWVQYYLKKNTLSIASIREIIATFPKYERSLNNFYSADLAEKKYIEYLTKNVNDANDYDELQKGLKDRNILILCPGNSLNTHYQEIKKYIEETHPVVISTNFLTTDFKTDYCFVSNAKRLMQVAVQNLELDEQIPLITTSNLMTTSSLKRAYTFNYKKLYDDIGGDNSCVMLLDILKNAGIGKVAIAGFDGWENEDGYVDDSLEWFQPEKNNSLVIKQLDNLMKKEQKIEINCITPSVFA